MEGDHSALVVKHPELIGQRVLYVEVQDSGTGISPEVPAPCPNTSTATHPRFLALPMTNITLNLIKTWY